MVKEIKIKKSPNSLLKKFFNLRVERVYPRGFERFAIQGKDLIGVEIGVYEGEHALSLLKYLDIKKLYLIDPYITPEEYNEVLKKRMRKAKKKAYNLLNRYNKSIFIYKYSNNSLKEIKEKLDFVYIDGNHEYRAVKEDIKNYWKLVKEGGVLGGHDVHNATRPHNKGVVKAVFEFALSRRLDVSIQGDDWWLNKPISTRRKANREI